MTYWKCPSCSGEGSTENNITIKICPCCQVLMKPNAAIPKREVEVKG